MMISFGNLQHVPPHFATALLGRGMLGTYRLTFGRPRSEKVKVCFGIASLIWPMHDAVLTP